jgi:hypothetical protein
MSAAVEGAMARRKITDIVQLSKIRMRESLRRHLEREAKKADRPLSAEIVYRLERSFEGDDLAAFIFGGQHNASLARLTALTAALVEHKAQRSWKDDPELRERVANVIDFAIRWALRGGFSYDVMERYAATYFIARPTRNPSFQRLPGGRLEVFGRVYFREEVNEGLDVVRAAGLDPGPTYSEEEKVRWEEEARAIARERRNEQARS